MKKRLLKYIALILSLSCIISMVACGSDEKQHIIFESIIGINNIDPILADNETEFEIVYNSFEGLFKYDSEGNISNGVISDYSVSKDELTYTFIISESAKWSDGTPLTADDFVFAFQRAVDPETSAPYSYTLQPIKNVEKIITGKKSKESIGVKAKNRKELKIELEYKTKGLEELLTTPITMPCNREFFEKTKGYYGLNGKSIITNGVYTPKVWNEEYFKISQNEEYHKFKPIKYSDVFIYFTDSDSLLEGFQKQDADFSILDYASIDLLKENNLNINTQKVIDTTHFLVFNDQADFMNENILTALYGSIDITISDQQFNDYGAQKSSSLLPKIITESEKINAQNTKNLSNKKSQKTFIAGCDELTIDYVFPTITILYINDPLSCSIAKQIAARWQNLFGITVNIESVPDKNGLINRVNSNSYQIALCPAKAISNSASSFLYQFTSNSPLNFFNFKSEDFDSILKKLGNSQNEARTKKLNKLANLIEKGENTVPLFESSTLYYINDSLNLQINKSNKIVYFSYCE